MVRVKLRSAAAGLCSHSVAEEVWSDPDNDPTPVLSNPLGSTANQVRASCKPAIISIIMRYAKKTTGSSKGLRIKSAKVQRCE